MSAQVNIAAPSGKPAVAGTAGLGVQGAGKKAANAALDDLFAALLDLTGNAQTVAGTPNGNAQNANNPFALTSTLSQSSQASIDLSGLINLKAQVSDSSGAAKNKDKPADPLAAVLENLIAALKDALATRGSQPAPANPVPSADKLAGIGPGAGLDTPPDAGTQKLDQAANALIKLLDTIGSQSDKATTQDTGAKAPSQLQPLSPALADSLKSLTDLLTQVQTAGMPDPKLAEVQAHALALLSGKAPPQLGQAVSSNQQPAVPVVNLEPATAAAPGINSTTGTPGPNGAPVSTSSAAPAPANPQPDISATNTAANAAASSIATLLGKAEIDRSSGQNPQRSLIAHAGEAAKTGSNDAPKPDKIGVGAPANNVHRPVQAAAGAAIIAAVANKDTVKKDRDPSIDPLLAAQAQSGDRTAQAGTLRPANAAYAAPVTRLNMPNIALEIARHANNGINRFEIRLDPAEMGRIDVKLDLDGKGGINAHLRVDRPDTLNLLQRDSHALERALAQSGLDAGKTNLEFSLRQNPFAGQQNGGNANRGSNPTFTSAVPSNGNEPSLPPPPQIYRGYVRPGGVNMLA